MSVNKLLFDERIKPKNVLALNEKVAAIRRYEADPVYKKIGRLFNCSPDQIKRIVKQKNEILAEWDNRTRKRTAPTLHEIKTVKISFLEKAVHEWIRRIMYYTDFNLNDTLIQTMSLEFSKALKLTNFYPTKEWIAGFRAIYNLPDANTKTMSIGYQESHSVQIRDILAYVKEVCGTTNVAVEDVQSNSKSTNIVVTAVTTAAIPDGMVQEIKSESDSSNFSGDFVIKVEDENCEPSCSTIRKIPDVPAKRTLPTLKSAMAMQIDTESTNYRPVQINSHEQPKPKKIAVYSHEAAISCVKLLEEFALLKENFRLIGLIERLEEALNDKPEK